MVGLLALAGWLHALTWSRSGPPAADPGALGYLYLTLGGLMLLAALEVEGLYLPRSELDRLLSAPLRRADIVRYRYLLSVARLPFSVVVIGVLAGGWAPRWPHLLLGLALYLAFIAALAQVLARLLGAPWFRGALGPAFRWMRRGGMAAFFVAVCAGLGLFTVGGRQVEPLRTGLRDLAVLVDPWVRISVAERFPAPTVFLAALLLVGTVELAALLPVDFREAAVRASPRIHRRRQRVRAGRWGAGEASFAGLGVPWWAGRGPVGAVAWLQSVRLVRNAGRTVTVSLITIVLLLAGLAAFAAPLEHLVLRTLAVYGLLLTGTFYLCGTLRADFRSLLDHMEAVRAWPLERERVFLAVLLPQVLLIVLVMGGAVGGWLAARREANLYLLLALPLLPPLVLALLAVDNIVFLLAPMRVVPGQEALFYNVGRMFLLALLRIVVFSLMGCLLVGAIVLATSLGRVWLGWHLLPSAIAGTLVGLALLPLVDLALVVAGGRALARFDPSRPLD